METHSRFISQGQKAGAFFLAAAAILTSCSYDPNELKGYPGIDSSAVIDGPSAGAAVDSQRDSPLSPPLDGTVDVPKDMVSDSALDLRPDAAPDAPADSGNLLSGMLAYYKCESATGTTLPDSSGRGNNGTLAGSGYVFTAGKVGNALALAKAGQAYVSLPPSVFANAADITIATWVNVTTSQNWARVFDVGINANLAADTSTGTKYMNLAWTSTSSVAFAITNNGYSNQQSLTASTPPTGVWKHLAVVLAAGTSTLYVDGVAATPALW